MWISLSVSGSGAGRESIPALALGNPAGRRGDGRAFTAAASGKAVAVRLGRHTKVGAMAEAEKLSVVLADKPGVLVLDVNMGGISSPGTAASSEPRLRPAPARAPRSGRVTAYRDKRHRRQSAAT